MPNPVRSIALALGALAACWILLMPLGSGPDEQSHVTRAGGVVRGDLAGDGAVSLPDRYQVAEAGCYAFRPDVAASCAFTPEHVGATLRIPTRAGDYPVWGHAWYGVVTLLPGLDPIWWARVGGAAAAIALVGWALVRLGATSPPMAAGLLLGVTPMAWSTFATVNPSTFAIAGAAALWTGLLSDDEPPAAGWGAGSLTAVGWAALVLPRRDGMVWAVIALVIALAVTDRTTLGWWRTLGRAQQAVIGGSSLVMVVWGALSEARSTQMIVLTPLALVAAEGWRRWWQHPVQTTTSRIASAVAAVVAGGLAAIAVVEIGPGTWDADLAVDVVMQTDDNLVEAIGVLGWLDTVVPAFAVYLWVFAIGALAAAALIAGARRTVAGAGALAVATVITSWVLELLQGDTTGLYWQGRYSLPLLVGLPLLLARPLTDRPVGDVTMLTAVAGLTVLNVAAWSAARRFGVGTSGSLVPWRWDTPIQPVPPLLLLVVHAAASIAVLLAVTGVGRWSASDG